MKILHKDLKHGIIKVKAENLDDLWYLNNIIDAGDGISGMTLRKVEVGSGVWGGGSSDGAQAHSRRMLFLGITSEKIELGKSAGILRITGRIRECPDDVPKGTYHTFNVAPDSVISIQKPKWLSFQLARLEEAAASKQYNIIIALLDREEAIFALVGRSDFTILSRLEGEVQKKRYEKNQRTGQNAGSEGFYKNIMKALSEYAARYNPFRIIVGSPGFWKEELVNFINDEALKKKIILATTSSVSEAGISEVMKRPEIKNVIKDDRLVMELNLVEEVLAEIGKNGFVAYGIKEVAHTAEMGAVKQLIVSDALISEYREKNIFGKLENVMKMVDNMNGTVTLVSNENEAGKKLAGLGGIAALLRYKTEEG